MRYKLWGVFLLFTFGLGLVSACFAQDLVRVREAATQIQFLPDKAVVDLQIENSSHNKIPAHVQLEFLDPRGSVRAQGNAEVSLSAGVNKLQVSIPVATGAVQVTGDNSLFWYRLRYSVSYGSLAGGANSPVSGVISVNGAAPQFFELHVAAPMGVRPGGHYIMRVRAIHPITLKPVAGVEVQASLEADDDEDQQLQTGTGVTDKRGFAKLEFTCPERIGRRSITVRATGKQGLFTAEAEGNIYGSRYVNAFLTSDKSLYQPGQTIHLRLLAFDENKKAMVDQEAAISVLDPDETLVYRVNVKTSKYGIASTDWQIPESLRLGVYSLRAKSIVEGDEGWETRSRAKISRYELPTFAVNAKPDRGFYLSGQNAEIEVRADYLFGKPVQKGHVRVVHETERSWNYREQKWETEEDANYEGELVGQGKFRAHVDLSEEHERLSEESGYRQFEDIKFTAYVTDASTGRTEERRFDVRVTRHPIHVYIIENSGHRGRGLPVDVYISTDYADGTPAECDVEFTWTDSRSEDEEKHQIQIGKGGIGRVHTNRYGVAHVKGLPVGEDSDDSFLSAMARDKKGAVGFVTEYIYALSADYGPGLSVETDKTLYRLGEPISVTLRSSEMDKVVFVEAVREERVIKSTTVRLHKGRASLTINPSEEFTNEVTIRAYILGINSSSSRDESAAFGSHTILIPKDNELSVGVQVTKAAYRPGEVAGANFRVLDPTGGRIRSALGVVVIDRAVDERIKTDSELNNRYWYSGFRNYWNEPARLSGVERSDLDKLDLSRPLPDGLELVAEILLQGGYGAPELFSSESRGKDLLKTYEPLIKPQSESIRAILNQHYDLTEEYPRTSEELTRELANAGVDLEKIRDPWGLPYTIVFSTEKSQDELKLISSGPDKRAGTTDDFIILTLDWPYFRPHRREISQAIFSVHSRTGEWIKDSWTLRRELAEVGVDLSLIRDRWGHEYRYTFEIRRGELVVIVTSGGPDGRFATNGDYSGDDFCVDRIQIDYFQETRERIEEALEHHFNATNAFPEDRAEFWKVLKETGIQEEGFRDPLGNPYYLIFREQSQYADDVIVESYKQPAGATGKQIQITPVTKYLAVIHVRSAGTDGVEGTDDDFDVATFVHAIARQSSEETVPSPAVGPPVLSGPNGAIFGVVTDPEGAVIPGARIVGLNVDTGATYSAKTGDSGTFLLLNLPPGMYRIEIVANLFKTYILTDVPVMSGNTFELHSHLEVGTQTVRTEVNAGGSVTLETTSHSVTTTAPHWGTMLSKSIQTALQLISTPRLRQYFPETLVWQPELITDAKGHARLTFPMADSITTWRLSVIASTENGLIGTSEKEIRSFQPFFVEHDPPRFLTVGDEIALPVVLRNYLDRKLQMNVEMKPESWFTLLGPAVRKSEIAPGDAEREVFPLRATIPIKKGKQRITASGAGAGDAIERDVTVRPNGEEKTETLSQVFNSQASVELQLPANLLPGSLDETLKIYPNLNAHVLEGIEAILERPYGCGEQTISSTYPSILLLKYAQQAGMDSSPLLPRARHYVSLGYQRLLSYRDENGAFTYWGRGDADLALTAYAIRFLSDAKPFVAVDDSVLREALEWLLKQQQLDGRWIARDWKGNEDERRSAILTGYIARVLTAVKLTGDDSEEDKQFLDSATLAVKHALEFLGPKTKEMDEPFLIASYVLAAFGTDDQDLVQGSLRRLRTLERREGETSYWALETNTPFYGWGLTGRIETTALVLQALTKGGDAGGNPQGLDELTSRGLLFLLRAQDRYGIWYSTQATVNVLDTLGLLTSVRDGGDTADNTADKGAPGEPRADVFVDGRQVLSIELPKASGLVGPINTDLSAFLSSGSHRVEVRRPAGSTPASLQVVASYYVPWTHSDHQESNLHQEERVSDALRLSVHFDKEALKVGENVQCSVVAERIGFRGFGMMLAEIGLPPGADVDRASLEKAMTESGWAINQYEVLPDRLIVYLWPHAGGTKFTFTITPRYGLNALSTPSVLYDYYNPEARAVVAPTRFIVH